MSILHARESIVFFMFNIKCDKDNQKEASVKNSDAS